MFPPLSFGKKEPEHSGDDVKANHKTDFWYYFSFLLTLGLDIPLFLLEFLFINISPRISFL